MKNDLQEISDSSNLAKDNRVGIFMFFIKTLDKKYKKEKDFIETRSFYGINVFKLREIIKYSDVNIQGFNADNDLHMGMFLLRDDVIPIINLPKWLGVELTKEELLTSKIVVTDFNHNKIGLLIAEPYRIEMKSWEEIETSDSYSIGEKPKIINHTKTIETNDVCFIIDIEGLLAEISPDTDKKINKEINSLKDDLSYITKKQPILIAEDSKVAQRYLSNIFKNLNLKFEMFENGQLLIDRYLSNENKKDIPLIITDLEMPVASGHKVIQEVRKQDKDIPILVNTSMTSENNMREVKSLGATDFIGKTDSNLIYSLIKKY